MDENSVVFHSRKGNVSMKRTDGRCFNRIRPLSLEPGYIDYPEGSVLITLGKTRVLCNVTVEEVVPRWMRESGLAGGWITAEYALLPRSTHHRTPRETSGLRGRTQEIRRMIGRSLRLAFNLDQLGERTFLVDCDVLQADGGTRTAAISGGYVALSLAMQKLMKEGFLAKSVFRQPVAAISVGAIEGQPLLDLTYEEDAQADMDLNVVMNAEGNYIEIQGTAERRPFDATMLGDLLSLARDGIEEILQHQYPYLAEPF
jgi:ribonuclease PH